ncbi:unnamed protein product [Adineta steineri]|uniref:Uncharacterized protein n=1 Tax=Adineta steineri TaxID=433720 RepID=A0A815LG41_9BILA|nr:unnamed protein product [Adineta steineri]CAF1406766.1 unnamed protein product [Adineta steineri]CAF1616227.1 unnamed protein product [Adineta steineri]CAF1616270.1 unnamed protein product [Adineta steineri]
MRLKTLCRDRALLELEGAIVNGDQMNLSNNVSKPIHHRSNTSFAFPTSFNSEISYPHLTPSADSIHEMSSYSFRTTDTLTASQASNMSSYRNLQAAYLDRGIRVHLSPRKAMSARQAKSERQPINDARPNTACVRRNPRRLSNTLQDTIINQDPHIESYSTLQQESANDFEQIHTQNGSNGELSSSMDEDDNYYTTSFITSEHYNPSKKSLTHTIKPTTPIDDNDPDIVYMSTLLKKARVESGRDTIRRHGPIRKTFSARPYSFENKSVQEKSPINNTNSSTRNLTDTTIPILPSKKLDQDILKHASRLRHDHSTKSHTGRINSASSRDSSDTHNNRHNSHRKILKSNNQESDEHHLHPPRVKSLTVDDLPLTKTLSITRNLKTSTKHIKSTNENEYTNFSSVDEQSNSSSSSNKGNLSLMRTSPLDIIPQSSLMESSWYDQSNSGSGDGQSLSSSSMVHLPGSILAGQLTHSATRRSHKKVSFYEEPRTVIFPATTTTFA